MFRYKYQTIHDGREFVDHIEGFLLREIAKIRIINIKEITQKTGLSNSTIRYYERSGLIPVIKKSSRGYRDFSENDLAWLKFVQHMRHVHVPVDTLAAYRKLIIQGDTTVSQRISLLSKTLADLQDTQISLADAIENLTEKVTHYEKFLKPLDHVLTEN